MNPEQRPLDDYAYYDMLIISCPFCGPRDESEFIHGGAARATRPDAPDALSDTEWIEYLTVPANPLGPVQEKWWHVRGCGEWVVIERDTRTHEICSQNKPVSN